MIEDDEIRNAKAAIRRVLMDVWDPIEIRDGPGAQNEYDSYLEGINDLLVGGASDDSIEEHLWRIVAETMGLDAAKKSDMTETVKALRQIPLSTNPTQPIAGI